MPGPVTDDVVALSVHGPAGVLDLHVPAGASGADVATEYSRQVGLPAPPRLYTRVGRPLDAELTLAELEVRTGAVLVAVTAEEAERSARGGRPARRTRRRLQPGALSVLWLAVAVATALLAGLFALTLPDDSDLRTATLAVLIGAAVVGVLPIGPLAPQRVVAAPAFAFAAAFVIAYDPTPERLPTVLGVAALAAAVCAGVGRALATDGEEGLRIWLVTGSLVFVLTVGAALADVPAQVLWSVLLLIAMLAPRFVPGIAVDVPDQYLIDLERLAVTAWSARERPSGRRGRIIVPRRAVVEVAARGTRMVTAASAAVLAVASLSALLLLAEVDSWIDVLGARVQVGLTGLALLLAARSYRHAGARALLRCAGLACLGVLFLDLAPVMGDAWLQVVAWVSVGLGGLVIVVAVALGRGWRSAWWARRAEVAESICAAFAVGSVVAAAGFFRGLWNLVG